MIAPFDYHTPASLPEALAALERYGDDAAVMAGGTAVVLLMKQGLLRPGHLIALRELGELQGISRDAGGTLRIGALATHHEAESSPLVASHCRALAEAFARVATIRIRSQATVGGNLAHADPAQDPPPMLLALDAGVTVASPAGQRSIPLEGFFTDVFETSLAPNELILDVRVPSVPARARATYLKYLPRSQDDYATVSVAMLLERNEAGVCIRARIALGAVGPTPIRAHSAEAALVGSPIDRRAIDEAADLAADSADPIDDLRGSADYKRQMVRVFVRRAAEALARGNS